MGKASPGEDGMVLRNPVDPASYMGSLVGDGGYLRSAYGVAKKRLGDLVLERAVIWNTSLE